MRSIWKFKLNSGITEISAKVYKWLNIGEDPSGDICVWAVVDPDATAADMQFYEVEMYGTGWDINKKLEFEHYLGTINDGPYIWHFFVRELGVEKEKVKSYDNNNEFTHSYDDEDEDIIRNWLHQLIPNNGGMILGR